MESFYSILWIPVLIISIISIIEMISSHLFLKSVFGIGIPAIRRTIKIQSIDFNPNIDITYKESEGKFRFTIDRKVYFLSKMFWFKFNRFQTSFPLKAIGTINENNTIDIVARLPIGTSLFLLFWILVWSIGSIENGIMFGLIGWIVAGTIIWVSYLIEKNRMEDMIDELKEIITRSFEVVK